MLGGMSQALVSESGRLVLDLHGALSEIDAGRWRAGMAEEARLKIDAINERLTALIEARWPEQTEALRERLATLRDRLARELPDPSGTAARMSRPWVAYRSAVTPAYEALSRKLREHQIHVPTLRPSNHFRSVVHVGNALLCIGILYAVPHPAWILAATIPAFIWAWTVEIMRRTRPEMNEKVMRFFGPVAHHYEHHRINSATWYVSTILLLSFTMSPLICAIGLAVLGVGDPAAGFVGRKWGRMKIMHGRTLEGALAFVLAATPAAMLAAYLFAPGLPILTVAALAFTAASAGAVAEMVSLRVDDNLSIGLVSAGAAALMSLALSVPL